MNNKNNYSSFLRDRKDNTRLNILNNYKQISRVMNRSYINKNRNNLELEQALYEGTSNFKSDQVVLEVDLREKYKINTMRM